MKTFDFSLLPFHGKLWLDQTLQAVDEKLNIV
jgi:hypothetical protein